MDSDEEYPHEVISTITVSRSQEAPMSSPGSTHPDKRKGKGCSTDMEDVEVDVPFPEIKSKSYEDEDVLVVTRKRTQGQEVRGKNRRHLNVKFQDLKEEPEDQDDQPAEAEDPSGQKPASGRHGRPLTKVVIRRLPPAMTLEEFIEAVQPLPEHNFTSMSNPDIEWGFEARSVAHINFLEEEDAMWFIGRFTGYRFIDIKGDEYVSVCDEALHPGVPRSGKVNPLRGTLEESEDYQEFLKRYEENPYTLEGETPEIDGEMLTPEMMLAELEEKTTAKETETTPLLDFIKNKKAAIRKERDVKRLKERRSLEKREMSESKYREVKRERKRDRRDKERKERRDKDKLEKEAKTKGMTITYSKSGKVTRWSTNSSPFPKKGDEEKAQSKTGKDEEGGEKLSSIGEDTESKPSSRVNDREKSVKTERFDKHEPKKKMVNPLQSKGRPSDSKKFENSDDKSRFCKPFPVKEYKKEETSRKEVVKPSSSSASEKPANKPKDGSDPQKPPEDKGKKKIIKKIIKIRRVRPKTIEEGSEPTVEGSTTEKKESAPAPKKVGPSFKPSSDLNSKFKENSRPKSDETTKSKGDHGNPKSAEKFEVKKSSEDGNASGSKLSTVDDEGAKRRRARPDMQIYRPGRLRKPTTNSDSKSADKDIKDT